MSDLIDRQAALDAIQQRADRVDSVYSAFWEGLIIAQDIVKNVPSAEPERKWTVHEVACILSELFGDDCACNFNGIDEWLPEKCELQDACPNPVGVACWEQYLKHRCDR